MLYFLLEERDGIMGKVAVVTDSNSGITQAQGTELGIFVLPMPFMIDEEQFFEDVNLTQEQFYINIVIYIMKQRMRIMNLDS